MTKLLLKSGIVVTQDAKLGVLPTGDVLVENRRIAAIAPTLEADAETIDCAWHFALPGLADARRELERLLAGPLAGRNALLTLGMAVLGPHYSALEVSAHDFALAREIGLIASMHQGGGEAKTPGGWETLMAQGVVGPHTNIVHGNNLTDAQLKAFVDLGASFSITPENEMTQGHGHPITGRLRALGSGPSVGFDLESAVSGDMFTVARLALSSHPPLDNPAEPGRSGGIPATSTLPAAAALDWVTTPGAPLLGMSGP